MGLPSINIVFVGKGSSAITRSARGIVAMIIRDESETATKLQEYISLSQVDFKTMKEANYDAIKLAFEGLPSKIMVVTQGKESTTYDDALKLLKNYQWNYLTIPEIVEADVIAITGWIKEQRDNQHKTFKAVLPQAKADYEGIINFTTAGIESSLTKKTHTATSYCPRIAGLLAGLPLNRSSTYYELSDIVKAETPENADELIDKGEFVIVYDGSKYKVGRGVNSFTTATAEKGKDLSKIKIIEGKDMVTDDITSTFSDNYVGKHINNYDNKQMLVAAILNYFKELKGDVLDPDYENTVGIDTDAQIKYLTDQQIDTSKMTEQQIATANTGSTVFLRASIMFVDAMEDLQFKINM